MGKNMITFSIINNFYVKLQSRIVLSVACTDKLIYKVINFYLLIPFLILSSIYATSVNSRDSLSQKVPIFFYSESGSNRPATLYRNVLLYKNFDAYFVADPSASRISILGASAIFSSNNKAETLPMRFGIHISESSVKTARSRSGSSSCIIVKSEDQNSGQSESPTFVVLIDEDRDYRDVLECVTRLADTY